MSVSWADHLEVPPEGPPQKWSGAQEVCRNLEASMGQLLFKLKSQGGDMTRVFLG